jgi:hypothetical protein
MITRPQPNKNQLSNFKIPNNDDYKIGFLVENKVNERVELKTTYFLLSLLTTH